MEARNFKVQLITSEGKWPYVGNARLGRNGSLNVYLDQGVTITGGQKLYIRPAREQPETDPVVNGETP